MISVTIKIFRPELPVCSHRCIGKIIATELGSYRTKTGQSCRFQRMNLNWTQLTVNLQKAINTLAPEKTFESRKHAPPWLNAKLRLLIVKRDATNRRYSRTGSRQLLDEHIDLANTCKEKCEVACCAYMHDRISDTLHSGKNFWKELRNLGLILKAGDALHGFMPDELNDHFSSIAISPTKDPFAPLDIRPPNLPWCLKQM